MRVDPFDLSTWYHLDRHAKVDGGPVTREELAAKLCDSDVELHRALMERDRRERQLAVADKDRIRSNDILDALINTRITREDRAGKPGEPVLSVTDTASSDAAVAFAKSVSKWQAAGVLLQTAQAKVDAISKEVERNLDALVADCRDPRP